MLCCRVGVGVGDMRISGRRFIAFLARRAFSKDINMCGRLTFGIGGCGVCVGVGCVFVGVGTLDCCVLCVVCFRWHQDGFVCRACGCNAVVGP